ncbi:cytochrome P450, partial [Cynara cardunculus var. scolymus]
MEISDSIIRLIAASYETTSSTVTFVLKYLAELPDAYTTCGSFREVVADFTYADFTIPNGWKYDAFTLVQTFWTVHTMHNSPKYFPDPEKFDSTRFEGSGRPVPYTFIPFGVDRGCVQEKSMR